MRLDALEPAFVEFVPSEIAPGVLYLAMKHATMVHLCPCSCGTKVVTPLGPADWQLFFDGDSVSVTPSIGNWQFPCRSHYWIHKSRVRWATPMADAEIALMRQQDARDREEYFDRRRSASDVSGGPFAERDAAKGRLLRQVWKWLRRAY